MHQTPEVSFPTTNLEVEILLPIPFGGRVLKARSRCVRILLGESSKGLQDENQATHQEISSNVFDFHCYLLPFTSLSRQGGQLSALDHGRSCEARCHARKIARGVVCNNIHFDLLRYNHLRVAAANETHLCQLPPTDSARPPQQGADVSPAVRLVSERHHRGPNAAWTTSAINQRLGG